ncbi:MAG: carboxypeptidase regulatory-like domain-containing protein [Nitrospinota bacterium]|nr:carboxypeptidase regulatory-like domain-containing protein [Nitrospinota bacterium]
MIKRTFILTMLLGLVLVLGSGNSFAAKKKFKPYEGGAPGGGSLTGTVSYSGPSKDVTIDFTKFKNPEFCVTHPDSDKANNKRIDHKIVAKGGKLKDAMVFIANIDKGKDWPVEKVQVNWKFCDIQPRMFAVRRTTKEIKKSKATTLLIENHDQDIAHNPHGYISVKGKSPGTLFNKLMPSKGSTVDPTKTFKKFKRKKKHNHFFLQCDNHNFMETDGRIVWNPYYSATGADGSYKIEGIPDGKYNVCAWHPHAGGNTDVCQEVEVKGASKANFTVK